MAGLVEFERRLKLVSLDCLLALVHKGTALAKALARSYSQLVRKMLVGLVEGHELFMLIVFLLSNEGVDLILHMDLALRHAGALHVGRHFHALMLNLEVEPRAELAVGLSQNGYGNKFLFIEQTNVNNFIFLINKLI